jgi:hypothetical protein
MRWAEHVAYTGEGREVYRVLVRKHEGKRPFGRRRSRWKDGTKKDLGEIVREGVRWIHLAQDSYGWWALVMNLLIAAPLSYLVTGLVKCLSYS